MTDYLTALPSVGEWITETVRQQDWRDAFSVFMRACGGEGVRLQP